jgi:hypothetical protein
MQFYWYDKCDNLMSLCAHSYMVGAQGSICRTLVRNPPEHQDCDELKRGLADQYRGELMIHTITTKVELGQVVPAKLVSKSFGFFYNNRLRTRV